ncbi:GNAT family N-acetyltransferase [Streptomyces sp. AC154]|uniref:GNAT family N-acetyltransferase n=1 Tax=Streptomyces sp. AC154 TaxID=3143184 RepID=UPI003F7F0845
MTTASNDRTGSGARAAAGPGAELPETAAGSAHRRAARVRRAVSDDVPALVRMRALMLSDMGLDTGDERAPWRAAAARWFAGRMPLSDEFAAFLVEDPELGVVACAVGACDAHAPSPANPGGLHGHVSNVSTDPRRRRLGHARACVDALLTWFEQETRVAVVSLNATGDGAGLYESFGFAPPRHPSLQLRISGPSA